MKYLSRTLPPKLGKYNGILKWFKLELSFICQSQEYGQSIPIPFSIDWGKILAWGGAIYTMSLF